MMCGLEASEMSAECDNFPQPRKYDSWELSVVNGRGDGVMFQVFLQEKCPFIHMWSSLFSRIPLKPVYNFSD